MTALYDSQGRPVGLGAQLGQGGEGAVYEVTGHGRFAAKVYHRPVDARHAAKLAAMIRLWSERLGRLSAWPVDTLHTQPGGPVTGLVMPKLTGYKAIHKLYGPKTRLAEFPDAGWPFLIHAAANLARAFAVLHEHGHVAGDVNHANVLVSAQATVRFIDCDSFQIRDGGTLYRCEVGVSTYTPPELQGVPLGSVTRTPNHDAFGLAVLIFQLLFMARHPFAGSYLGAGEMPIEQAIKEYRFAYGSAARSRQMQQPPASLSLAAVSRPVALLFERAFSPEGSRDGARPGAREWVDGLEQLAVQLGRCPRIPSHYLLSSLGSCPWCDIEGQAGIVLFNVTVARGAAGAERFDLAAVWAQIIAVPSPGPPPLPAAKALGIRPSSTARAYGRRRRAQVALGGVIAVCGVMIALALGSAAPWVMIVSVVVAIIAGNRYPKEPRAEARRRLTDAQSRWQAINDRWQREAGERAFQAELAGLRRRREQYERLPAERQRRLNDLHANRRGHQLRKFLDQHRLATAAIQGIGSGRKATLQSYNIETAADIAEAAILRIPGFGPGLTGNLLAWRRQIEQRFVFDASRAVEQRDIDEIEREFAATRAKLEQALHGGAARLTQIAQQTLAQRPALQAEVERAQRELAQAEADAKAF